MLESDSSLAQAVMRVVREAGVPVREMWSGDTLRVGGACRLEALHPLQREAYSTDNAASLVLAIEYAGRDLEGAQAAFRGTTRRVWHTARDGAVTALVLRSGDLTVKGWRAEP